MIDGLELPNNADLSVLRHEVDEVPYDADSVLVDLLSPVFAGEYDYRLPVVLYIPTDNMATMRLRVVEPRGRYVATAVADSMGYDLG